MNTKTKNKGISWIICPYDYTPDYEETYKGITFTVGIELYGHYAATIEFDTPERMYTLLGIDKEHSGDNPRVSHFPFIEQVFHTSDIDIFTNEEVEGNKACMLIRSAGFNSNPSNKEVPIVTLGRLEYAHNKYSATFEKFPDTIEKFAKQRKSVEENPFITSFSNLSEDDIVDAVKDMNESFIKKKYNMTINYLTEKIVVDMCHKFIDRLSSQITVYDKHKGMLDRLNIDMKSRRNRPV